ncbi:patatin-like phospholipase family protein [Streptomyces sp. 900105755]
MHEDQPQLTGEVPAISDTTAVRDREEAQKTEVRLALVMNGGVSLAVWMGGVTHELDLLRRASRGDDPSTVPDPNDRLVFKLWQDVATSQNKIVRIDVIAGTSAGGLNGLLLATAIGRNAALPDLRKMWRDSASLDALLKPRAAHSVLNGDLLERQVKAALDQITEKSEPDGETVTLFITATALAGGFKPHEDGFGQRFDVRDHRRLYRFKNQPKYREKYTPSIDNENGWTFQPDKPLRDFASSNEANLLRASRATASYPVAFSPVYEGDLTQHIQDSLAINNGECCLTDGGVLNNAPFGPVLEEITKRRVDKTPVDRILVYVVPTVGVPPVKQTNYPASEQNCPTTPLGAVISRAIKHPTEVDFRSGIEDLHQRLQTSIRGSRDDLFRRIIDEANGGLQRRSLRDAAANLLDDYRRSRARAVLLDVVNKRLGDVPTTLTAPPHIDTRSILEVLSHGSDWFPPSDPAELELSARLSETAGNEGRPQAVDRTPAPA